MTLILIILNLKITIGIFDFWNKLKDLINLNLEIRKLIELKPQIGLQNKTFNP